MTAKNAAKKPVAAPAKSAPVQLVKPRKLDRSRTHAQVYGLSGAHFEQDGFLFGQDGREVKLKKIVPSAEGGEDQVAVLVGDTAKPAPAATVKAPVDFEEEEPVVGEQAPDEEEVSTPYETMSAKALKSLVSVYDEPFTTREAAIDFLRKREDEAA